MQKKETEKCNNSKIKNGVQATDKSQQRTRRGREEISEAVAGRAASLHTAALAFFLKKKESAWPHLTRTGSCGRGAVRLNGKRGLTQL